MQVIKFSLIFISLFVYLILGALINLLLFWAKPAVRLKTLNLLTYRLMHVFKLIAGLNIIVKGKKEILKEKGLFIYSTHIGYLDGVVLGSLVPGSFTTKSQIKKVPLLGHVVAIGGSIFIDRHKKGNIIKYINTMADRLKDKINVFNFPEGHAADGKKILPFFPSFFNAPLLVRSSIVPVTIDYAKVDGKTDFNKDEIYCYNGSSIIKHLWNLMKFKSIEIVVEVHQKIIPNGCKPNFKGRKEMSELCLNRISKYKNLPVSDYHPFKARSTSKLATSK